MVDVVLLHCKQFKAFAPSKLHNGIDVGDEVLVCCVICEKLRIHGIRMAKCVR